METRSCITCHKVKPLDDYHWRKDNQTHHGECKVCRALRSKTRYAENPERHAVQVGARYRTFGRFARYGITRDQYEVQFEKQCRRCALCGATEPGGKGEWCIDHAHDGTEQRGKFNQSRADQFRGITCARCNIALGHYEALAERVGHERVEDYLKVRALA